MIYSSVFSRPYGDGSAYHMGYMSVCMYVCVCVCVCVCVTLVHCGKTPKRFEVVFTARRYAMFR